MGNPCFFSSKTFDRRFFSSSLRITVSGLPDPFLSFLHELGPPFTHPRDLSFEHGPGGHGTLGRPSRTAAGTIAYVSLARYEPASGRKTPLHPSIDHRIGAKQRPLFDRHPGTGPGKRKQGAYSCHRFERLLGRDSAHISSGKASHTAKRSFHAGRVYDIVGHFIGIHHADGSTLAGPCRFPVLEAETHQLEAVLDQDSADLRITDLPNDPSPIALHPGAYLLGRP